MKVISIKIVILIFENYDFDFKIEIMFNSEHIMRVKKKDKKIH